jgi:hypothetical protein
MVPMAVLGRNGEGRVDGVILGCDSEGQADDVVSGRFNVEEWGAGTEAHVEDAVEADTEDVEEEWAPPSV